MSKKIDIENKEIYLEVFKQLSVEVHIWQLIRDKENKIVSWKLVDANPATLKAWGKELSEIKGKKLMKFSLKPTLSISLCQL